MSGNIHKSNYKITHVSDTNHGDVVNKQYVDSKIDKVNAKLSLVGGEKIAGDIDMNKSRIKNLGQYLLTLATLLIGVFLLDFVLGTFHPNANNQSYMGLILHSIKPTRAA